MEAKTDRRHTADEVPPIGRGSKEVKGDDYSLETKFAAFAKISPDETPPASPDAKVQRRCSTEGCDAKLLPGAGKADSKAGSDDDDSADREFEEMMRAPDQGSVAVAAEKNEASELSPVISPSAA